MPEAIVSTLLLFILGLSLNAYLADKIGTIRSLAFFPILIGLLIFFSVEVLSIFNQVNYLSLRVVLIILIGFCLANIRNVISGLKKLFLQLRDFYSLYQISSKGIQKYLINVGFLIAVVSVTVSLVVALIFPPNNLDSLAYHLPRMMVWLQNGNVNFFQTNNNHQLDIPPLGEYAGLFLYSINGNDGLLNLVQFFSFIYVLLISGAISWLISKDAKITLATIVFVSSTQVILTQATTTQVDLFAALWPIIAILCVIAFSQKLLSSKQFFFIFASAFLLAATTKPTVLLYLAPIAIFFVYTVLVSVPDGKFSRLKLIAISGVFATIATFIGFFPQTLRNFQHFGNLFGSHTSLVNEKFGVLETFLGVGRIYLNNIGLPFEDISRKLIEKSETFFGFDWTDPSTVLAGHFALVTSAMGLTEDVSRGPFQLFFGSIAAFVILFERKLFGKHLLGLSVLFFGFILIQASILKWNFWTNRFYIPIFILGAILFCIVFFEEYSNHRPKYFWLNTIGSIVLVVSGILGLFLTLNQPARPIDRLFSGQEFSREMAYFGYYPQDFYEYQNYADLIKKLPTGSEVRIFASQDQPTYVLWPFANNLNEYKFTFVSSEQIVVPKKDKHNYYNLCLHNCEEAALRNPELKFINF